MTFPATLGSKVKGIYDEGKVVKRLLLSQIGEYVLRFT